MYIYKVTNETNGKIYIGLSTKPYNTTYKGSGKLITKAINKYGTHSFKKEPVEECNSIEELKEAEIKWINHYNSDDRHIGYNLSPGGDTNPDTQRKPIYQYSTDGVLIESYESIEYAKNAIGDSNVYRKKERNTRPIKGYWFTIEPKSKDEILGMHKEYEERIAKIFKQAAVKRWADDDYRNRGIVNMKKAQRMKKDYSKSEETRKKLSKAIKGRKWYHSENEEGQYYECPDGWSKGRLKKNN